MNSRSILGRFGVIAASVLVGMTLAGVVGHAAVTLSTANSVVTNYTLAAGATSAPIYPPTNTGVILMGTNTTSSDFSVGSVNLVHISGVQIRWVGLESPPSAAIVHGATTTPGTHMMYLDYNHKVDVEILSADQIVVHNASTTSETGSVKMIW